MSNETSSEPRYPYVVVDVESGDAADEAASELFDLGAQGVEERDATTLLKAAQAGKVTLVASFASHEAADEAIRALPASWSPRLEEVVGDAWRDEWKKHFHPFAVCEGIVVRPPWEAYAKKPGDTVLELEPGRAFGTGLHETTSLVAQLLAAHGAELRDARVLDVGCGSGILSLVALGLGAAHARAIDVEEDAVLVTRENAARNAMSSRIEADTTDVALLGSAWPVVVANIEARVLVPLAATIASRVAPGGLLILSGILLPQKDDVCAAYAPGLGFALLPDGSQVKGEWVALALRRHA
jgi:ribosomal protein L11 methyltransferase